MPIDLQTIDTGAAARLRVALAGEGPLIVLIHGFPESWYSWRHQIPVLAEAGFRVAAPDVRGYGGSDKPHAIDAYAIKELSGDIAGLIAVLGARQAVVIGHDWGAPIAYGTALFHPARVRAVAGLSVPYLGRGPVPSVELFRRIYQDRFFYQLYFQEPASPRPNWNPTSAPACASSITGAAAKRERQMTGSPIPQDRDCSIAWSIPRSFHPG
jgi:pimeloyl-ACP methyl ester carboxylesterase